MMPRHFRDTLLDNFFCDGWMNPHRPGFEGVDWMTGMMKTDIKKTEEGLEMYIDLPGYTKENVTAELKHGWLKITVTTEEEAEDTDYVCRERFAGTCSRRYFVGKQMTEEDIKARFENGVLIVTVPKKDAEPIEEKKYITIEG